MYVTHDQEEAFSMSDRVAVMNRGLLEHVGSPTDVYSQPRTLFVADFVGASNGLKGTVVQQRGADTYTINIPTINDAVEVIGVAGLTEGDQVVALLRPEDAELQPPTPGRVCVSGVIQESSYYGPQVTYTLILTDGDELRVTCKPDTRTGPLPLGETVTAGWDPTDVWLLPADKDAATRAPDADPSPTHVPQPETSITDR